MLQIINQNWLSFMNNLLEYQQIECIVYIMADAPIFFIPLFLVWFWIYYNYRFPGQAWEWYKSKLLFIFYSTIIAITISIIIQQFVDINRPEEYLKNTWKLILEHIPDASFPSDHASVSIAFLTSLFLFWFKRIAFIVLPFFILMNLSRTIAWLHWPFDIIAWTFVWLFSAFIVFKLQKNNYLEKLNSYLIKVAWFFKM